MVCDVVNACQVLVYAYHEDAAYHQAFHRRWNPLLTAQKHLVILE